MVFLVADCIIQSLTDTASASDSFNENKIYFEILLSSFAK